MEEKTSKSPWKCCTLCGKTELSDFYSIRDVPVTCTSVFDTVAEATAIPRGNINLAICNACFFVFNRSFDSQLGDLGARYESSQSASPVFSKFSKSLACGWVEKYKLAGKHVIEIGCGSGEFLVDLLEFGVGRTTGIDPLTNGMQLTTKHQNIKIIPELFDERHLGIQADALICRHTLEHISDVNSFLGQLRKWAELNPDAVILIEIPDAERIFAERAFWDIYYEHCNYFTAETVRFAFMHAGFEVLSVKRTYSDQYLLIEATLRAECSTSSENPQQRNPHHEYQAFSLDVDRSIDSCEYALAQLGTTSSPVIIWQGAAKTVGFLSRLNNPQTIGGAIDLSPQRQGRFLPGSGLAILKPDQLLEIRPDHIVLMNPVYLAEVRAQISALGKERDRPPTEVHSVNDLLDAALRVRWQTK